MNHHPGVTILTFHDEVEFGDEKFETAFTRVPMILEVIFSLRVIKILIMRLCLWTVSIFSRRLTDRINGTRVSVLYCVKNALHFVDESLNKLL